MKYKWFFFLFFLLFFISGCSTDADSVPPISSADKAFQMYTDEIFQSQVASDSLTLNYTLSHPEQYGIQNLPKGFSTPSVTGSSLVYHENELARLHSFSRDELSLDNQILYDVWEDTLLQNITSEKFSCFSHTLNPTTGIQAQLPVLLAEFRINSKEDLEQYFSLLKTMPAYFTYLLSLEEEKISKGTLPCKETLQRTISQCQEFLSHSGTRILEDSFHHRITNLSFLSEQEKKEAITTNQKYVKEFVQPAYQHLVQKLTALIESAPKNGALCSYPMGKEYYTHLVLLLTGSSRPLADLKQLMSDRLASSYQILLDYAKKNPALFSSCLEPEKSARTTKEILLALSNRFSKDFPACDLGKLHIKEVDKSLADYLSPAFYLTPPLDDENENTIYLNPAKGTTAESLWNTLAHEGIPGHLYQNVYFHQKNLPPLRYLLNYNGYTEGWASYVEIFSYQYTEKSREEIAILQNNMIMSLCLYGLCDIGIHYENWDIAHLQEFLSPYGYSDKQTAQTLYQIIVDDPASYLQYTVGYLEICELKKMAQEKWGKNYTNKRFHKYLLDVGPAPFDIILSFFCHF